MKNVIMWLGFAAMLGSFAVRGVMSVVLALICAGLLIASLWLDVRITVEISWDKPKAGKHGDAVSRPPR